MKRLLYNKPQAILALPHYLKVKGYTMLRYSELYQLYETLQKIEGLDGDVVETGSWKGGAAAFMGHVSGRHVWLFDSFQGFPPLSEKDKRLKMQRKEEGYIAVPDTFAREITRKLNVNATIVRGFFKDTLDKQDIGKIVLLHLDGDLYDSTKVALDTLYNKIVQGGYVIINDFDNFGGCRRAVYDFLSGRGSEARLMDYGYGGCKYLIKDTKHG